MNSSGIKRGLATTAVSALAVAGIPFIASSASAAPGDDIVFVSAGPARNAGDTGSVVVLKTKGVVPGNLALIGTNLTSSPNTPSQAVSIVGTPTIAVDAANNPNGGLDGFDEITVRIATTTSNDGGTASFAIYEEEGTAGVQPTEPSEPVSITTAGAPASIDVSPTLQSAPVNTNSGDYTLTIKDSQGRTTQLNTGEVINIAESAAQPGAGNMLFTDSQITADTPATDEAPRGTAKFKAQADAPDLYTIALAAAGSPAVAGATGSASLDVAGTVAANVAAPAIDIVTGADTWNGFGNTGGSATAAQVRPDQSTVTLNFKDATKAGQVVSVTVTGTGVTFGGVASTTVTTTLDANGLGSVDITPDAGTIQNGDSVALGGSINPGITLTYASPSVAAAEDVKQSETRLVTRSV